MTGTSGAPLAITLDGVHLDGISPQDVTVREEEAVTHRTASALAHRESRSWVDPGDPGRTLKLHLELDYAHVRAKAPLLDRLLAVPGAHRIILWKHVTTAHESDGVTQVLTLPRAFVQDALDAAGAAIVPPAGHPWSRFPVQVYLAGPLSAAVEPQAVSQSTWDAGDPPQGTVWRLTGQPLLKLAPEDVPAAVAPPAPPAYISVAMVPELRVHRVAPGQVSYRSPIPEPRRLELREV